MCVCARSRARACGGYGDGVDRFGSAWMGSVLPLQFFPRFELDHMDLHIVNFEGSILLFLKFFFNLVVLPFTKLLLVFAPKWTILIESLICVLI